MGDRGQVRLRYTDELNGNDIYIYTHWGALSMPSVVADALERGRDRWHDPCYLNRIIFSEFIANDVMGETGFGICTEEHGDVWRIIEVDHAHNSVKIFEKTYDQPVDDWGTTARTFTWEVVEQLDYQSFIDKYAQVYV